MHKFSMPAEIIERVIKRAGRAHPFDSLRPTRTALVVIDMQNYFVAPGYLGETPMARTIVPAINRLAAGLRRRGGHVVWMMNSTADTWDSWSVFNRDLLRPEVSRRRYETMAEAHEGHRLWPLVELMPEDARLTKKRFSAFIPGSSDLESHLRKSGIDTVLVAGTATNICCETSARDAMMLNFKTVMVHDALAAATDAEHNAALMNFYNIFGDVLSVDETLRALHTEE
jgi:ureidoacrylate peracid hydrolase